VKNYYTILGVHAESDDAEIKKAYQLLTRQFHPDRGGDPEKFTDVTGAYSHVRHAAARAQLRSSYALVAPMCVACNGAGCTQRQKGFTKVTKAPCASCQGAGYALEQAATVKSYRKKK